MRSDRGQAGLAALALLLTITGCKSAETAPVVVDEKAAQAAEAALPDVEHFAVTLSPAAQSVAAGQNDFAARLYGEIAATQDGDFMFSPASIAGALALARPGAKGETEAEFAALLKTPGGAAGTAAAGELFKASQFAARDRIVTMANAIWVDKNLALDPGYAATLKSSFAAEPHAADFGSDPDGAADAINDWANNATRGRIPSIMNPRALTQDTRLVLVNAAYFKARWLEEFDPDSTRDEDFTRADGSKTSMPMMKMNYWFNYARPEAEVQAIAMHYRGDETQMVVLLPDKTNGLAAIEKKITPANLKRWLDAISAVEPEEVILALPRFKREAGFGLNAPLNRLGLKKAFLPRIADFSGMGTSAGGDPLYINSVVHKTFIEVNERGTEAAAVTAADAAAAATDAVEHKPKVFRADHPFLYLIRDTRTGAILFLGRFTGAGQTQ